MRSIKYHLKRVIGAHTLTYEEMSTLLCKVEACLNSRLLNQMSDSLDDYTALTPNHFLMGSTLASMSEQTLLGEKEARLSRWQFNKCAKVSGNGGQQTTCTPYNSVQNGAPFKS